MSQVCVCVCVCGGGGMHNRWALCSKAYKIFCFLRNTRNIPSFSVFVPFLFPMCVTFLFVLDTVIGLSLVYSFSHLYKKHGNTRIQPNTLFRSEESGILVSFHFHSFSMSLYFFRRMDTWSLNSTGSSLIWEWTRGMYPSQWLKTFMHVCRWAKWSGSAHLDALAPLD